MDKTRPLVTFLLIVTILFVPFALASQTAIATEQGQSTSEQPQLLGGENSDAYQANLLNNEIKQPFSWESAGDVSQYEIIIERPTNRVGRYEKVFAYTTTREEAAKRLIYIDPPLPPGNYRSTIKVYNVLGLLEEDLTVHNEFVIKAALKPLINSVTYPMNLKNLIYLDDLENDGVVEVSGTNLLMPKSSIEDESYTRYELVGNGTTLHPTEILSHRNDNTRITLKFDVSNLKKGPYHVVAYDVSGLHSNNDEGSLLNVEFKKLMDVQFSLDYSGLYMFHVKGRDNGTMLPVEDGDITFYGWYSYIDDYIHPGGFSAKLNWIFYKGAKAYFGLGGNLHYARLFNLLNNNEHAFSNGEYKASADFLSGKGAFLFQFPLANRKLMLDLHFGVGAWAYYNLFSSGNGGQKFEEDGKVKTNENGEPINSEFGSAYYCGIGLQYYFHKFVYLDLGLDYTLILNMHDGGEVNKFNSYIQYMTPSIGIGVRF